MTAFPDTGGSDGLTLRCHLDRRDDRLGNIDQRLVLEVELKGLSQVRQSLLDALPLARDLNFKAASHEPLAVSDDSRGEVGNRGLSHTSSVSEHPNPANHSSTGAGWHPHSLSRCQPLCLQRLAPNADPTARTRGSFSKDTTVPSGRISTPLPMITAHAIEPCRAWLVDA